MNLPFGLNDWTLIWGGATFIAAMVAIAMNTNRYGLEIEAKSKANNVASLKRQSESAPQGFDPIRPEGHKTARAEYKKVRVSAARWQFFPVLAAGVALICAAMTVYTCLNP